MTGTKFCCPYCFDLPCAEDFIKEHKDKIAKKDLAKVASDEKSALHPYKHLFE